MKTSLYGSPIEAFDHLSDAQIMALTLYGEARGEPREGKIAVGTVILQRVTHRDWDGTDIPSVCLAPYQFSCYLPNDPNYTALKLIAADWNRKYIASPSLRECYTVALGLISGTIPQTDILAQNHCCQYVTAAYRLALDRQAAEAAASNQAEQLKKLDKKRWWKQMRFLAKIAAHEFYGEKKLDFP